MWAEIVLESAGASAWDGVPTHESTEGNLTAQLRAETHHHL